MEKRKKFLKSGKQAEITEKVRKLASSIDGKGLEYVINALKWLGGSLEKRGFDKEAFRKRTADQIIGSKFSTGCSDTAVVFIALCRAKRVPASYLEVISKKWLEGDTKRIEGHVFSRVLINNKWLLVDPMNGTISIKEMPNNQRWVVFDEGLDSWDLGIEGFSDLKDRFSKFKEGPNTS